MLASLHDEHGNTTIDGLDADGSWEGVDYPPEQFRADAQVLDGVELIGSGSVADMLWARPAVTVLGIDFPPVSGSAPAIQAAGRGAREPAGPSRTERAQAPRTRSSRTCEAACPGRRRCEIEPARRASRSPARPHGPAFDSLKAALEEATAGR